MVKISTDGKRACGRMIVLDDTARKKTRKEALVNWIEPKEVLIVQTHAEV